MNSLEGYSLFTVYKKLKKVLQMRSFHIFYLKNTYALIRIQ
jgi:hypothetical protein